MNRRSFFSRIVAAIPAGKVWQAIADTSPKVYTFSLLSKHVSAKPLKLKAQWTTEELQPAHVYMSVTAERILSNTLVNKAQLHTSGGKL